MPLIKENIIEETGKKDCVLLSSIHSTEKNSQSKLLLPNYHHGMKGSILLFSRYII